MLISIIIPTYNGGERVIEIIKRCKKIILKGHKKEIIVVDDCSPDKTYKKLKKIKEINLIVHKRNTGKGGALKTGFQHAKGGILVVQDDDKEYDPGDIIKLIKLIANGKADAVFGSRHIKRNKFSYTSYYLGGLLIDKFISLLLQANITDALTGSKALTRRVYERIKPIESKGFEIEVELTAKIHKKGFRILEIPITYKPRSIEEGKGIRWHHAIPILKSLFKYINYR